MEYPEWMESTGSTREGERVIEQCILSVAKERWSWWLGGRDVAHITSDIIKVVLQRGTEFVRNIRVGFGEVGSSSCWSNDE